jgi:hypothetical protein
VTNVVENDSTLGNGNIALLNAVKDLAGIHSDMASAARSSSSWGGAASKFVTEAGGLATRALDSDLKGRERKFKDTVDKGYATLEERKGKVNKDIHEERERLQAWAQELHERENRLGGDKQASTDLGDLLGALGVA